MIVILKKNAEKQQVELFDNWLHSMGLETHKSIGENHTIVGLVGDTSRVDIESVRERAVQPVGKRAWNGEQKRAPVSHIHRDFRCGFWRSRWEKTPGGG